VQLAEAGIGSALRGALDEKAGAARPLSCFDMAKIERGVPLVERVMAHLSGGGPGFGRNRPPARAAAEHVGASAAALDALESKLMVELPPTLRAFLEFDFTFASFGKGWEGRHRFGKDASAPHPKVTSVRKLAEAKTDLGWTDSRLRTKVVRLPNRPGHPWNALYLGEARRDGELVILGIENEDTTVRVFPRYTAFDLYLVDQLGLVDLSENARLEDLDSHLALNPELNEGEDDEERDADY
jgi:hypothetical protein